MSSASIKSGSLSACFHYSSTSLNNWTRRGSFSLYPPSLPSSPPTHLLICNGGGNYSVTIRNVHYGSHFHTLWHTHTQRHTRWRGNFLSVSLSKPQPFSRFPLVPSWKPKMKSEIKHFWKKKKKMMMIKWSENGHRFHWLKVGRFAYFLHRVNLSRVSFHRWELIRIPDASGCGWIR